MTAQNNSEFLPDSTGHNLSNEIFRRNVKLGSTILGVTLLVTGALYAGSIFGNKARVKENVNTPVAEAPVRPNGSVTSEKSPQLRAETVPSVESLEISAGLSPEKTAKSIVDHISALWNTGLNQKAYDKFDADFSKGGVNNNPTSWSERYTAPYVTNYMKAMCGDDYTENSDLAPFIERIALVARNHLDYYLRTDTNTGEGVEGHEVYKYKMDFEKLVSSNDGEYIINIHETDNNSDTNLAYTAWNFPSADEHNIIKCTTKIEKDPSGKKIVRITEFRFLKNGQ